MARNISPEVARHRARVAGLASRDASPERIEEARADLAAANLEHSIREALAAAPPMTDGQRHRLAALLTPGS